MGAVYNRVRSKAVTAAAAGTGGACGDHLSSQQHPHIGLAAPGVAQTMNVNILRQKYGISLYICRILESLVEWGTASGAEP